MAEVTEKLAHNGAHVKAFCLCLEQDEGPTVRELIALVVEHKIPATARIVYSGCGSHDVELQWVDHG